MKVDSRTAQLSSVFVMFVIGACALLGSAIARAQTGATASSVIAITRQAMAFPCRRKHKLFATDHAVMSDEPFCVITES